MSRKPYSKKEVLEAEAAENFYGGSASAFEEIHGLVMVAAKDAFSWHKDDEARMLRKMAQGFLDRANEERKKQEEQRKIVVSS